MRRGLLLCVSVVTCLAASGGAVAQEGHPLSGTWSGDWGATAKQRTRITLVMEWDGAAVTGIINPGPDAVKLGAVVLDVTNWTVRLQADSGKEKIAAEGRIEDLGSPRRRIAGTWIQGGTKGDFRVTRN